PEPVEFGQVDGTIKRLYVPDDGSALIVVTTDDQVRTLDPVSGEVLGAVQLEAVADVGPGGTASTLVSAPGAVGDPHALASALAKVIGGAAATYEARLAGTGEQLIIAGITGSTQQAAIQKAIDDGRLAGLSITSLPQVAVADANGLELINPTDGSKTATVDLGGAAHGLALATVDSARLYVSVDPDPAVKEKGRIAIVAVGGDQAKNGPAVVDTMAMPGPVTKVAYDDATEMVHVLGRTPDGTASTIYVIQPHADPGPQPAVYADARLPFDPSAWAVDVNRPYPTDDRQQILVFDGEGATASVDVREHEFAWRLPGVLAGTAMAGFLFVLARILFRRRTVGLFVAVMCVADGMLFVQSRIGMNDAYVGLGIVAAYTLFAALWTGVWRHRGAFWIAMPLIGAFLGLALASKWVALYAIVGMGFLVLVRSALGRLLAIAALVVMTAVLGYLAINVPQGTGFGNLPFVAIMVALTVVAVVANVLHPLRWSLDEIRFAIGGPVALGGFVALGAIGLGKATATLKLGPATVNPLEIAAALALVGVVAWLAFAGASRLGFGPFAPAP
ncbi:MAG TPA: phospholipid carrier-dependent glycosyltransferase, partial [Candidatus Limnocylindrales bacterium]|nr:phospholipid carrier-dependent glycosyltransferase [Candidatus Limnocylindrales bacterium]